MGIYSLLIGELSYPLLTKLSKDGDWRNFLAPINRDATPMKHNDEARLSFILRVE